MIMSLCALLCKVCSSGSVERRKDAVSLPYSPKQALELDDLKNRLFMLEERYHVLSGIHDNTSDDEGGDLSANEPTKAKIDFRSSADFKHQTSDFKHQHEGMRAKLKKFVTFKNQDKQEDGDLEKEDSKDTDFPPPPKDWEDSSSGYEHTSRHRS